MSRSKTAFQSMIHTVLLQQGLGRSFTMLIALYLRSLHGTGECVYTGLILGLSMKVILSPLAMPTRRFQMRDLQTEQ